MSRRGFTLVEMIIGLAASAIIAFVAMFLLLPADNWIFIIERRSGVTEARIAMVRMLREVGRVSAPGGVTALAQTKFAFVDIDGSAVSFEQSGTNLLRNDLDVLARNIDGLKFEYLKGDGTQATLASDIRVVRITLAIRSGRQTIRLMSAAGIKNGIIP